MPSKNTKVLSVRVKNEVHDAVVEISQARGQTKAEFVTELVNKFVKESTAVCGGNNGR